MSTTGRFARETTVPVERTEAEIKRVLMRYGAQRYGVVQDVEYAAVMFELHDRRVRMMLRFPHREEFTRNQSGAMMGKTQADQAYQKALRQRWRALLLVITAKLEAVESGIETLEEAFLAHIVLPNQQTYGEFAIPQIAESYRSGQMPPLVPGLPAPARVIELPERGSGTR